MSEPTLPRYPIFVPTKGRAHAPLTIRFLQLDEVPFRIVVVPEELEEYRKLVSDEQILVLPRGDLKLLGTRNWIRDVAEQEGHARHWQLDDNIRRIYRLWYGERLPCDAGPALRAVEDFCDRYTNIGVSGLNYKMFGLPNLTAYFVNAHVYSCTLINHEMPYRWRLIYNDDTDLCLQALGNGWCTVLVNAFLADKLPTMVISGGNTDDLYKIGVGSELEGPYAGSGRKEMAISLAEMWPGVVTIDRRFQRPQHVIDWRRFKQPLLRREGVTVPNEVDEYGLELRAVKKIKNDRIRKILEDYQREKIT